MKFNADLNADLNERAIAFYEKCGFTRAGKTEPMWIYRRAFRVSQF